MSFGFMRCGAAVPPVHVADCAQNAQEIISLIEKAKTERVRILVFPELCITGYTCGDLFLFEPLLRGALDALERIAAHCTDLVAIVSLPLMHEGRLFNCAAVLSEGRVCGVVPKTHVPNYSEFYEQRWFESGACVKGGEITLPQGAVPFGTDLIFDVGGCRFGIEICEDLWVPAPPSAALCMGGAQLIFNPSASNELVTKHRYRCELISQQSGRCIAGYVYAGAGFGESTTDLVFGGYAGIYENGRLLSENERFATGGSLTFADVDIDRITFQRRRNRSFFTPGEGLRTVALPLRWGLNASDSLQRSVSPLPFVPAGREMESRTREIIAIQKTALLSRLEAIHCRVGVVGVSGGLDSTLALLVAAHAFRQAGYDLNGLIAITMPGLGTGSRTLKNAHALMRELGTRTMEISIAPAVAQHFADIGQNPEKHDVTYENSQARERTQLLMDVANKEGGIVLGTGDLSEGALGWATYNGDHMSMYNINASVPKTLIKHLVHYMGHEVFGGAVAEIVDDILDTPISPELIPSKEGELNQRTEDVLGAYALHDFILYHFMDSGAGPEKLFYLAQAAFKDAYTPDAIFKALSTFVHRFFTQQFKRSCMPDGPKVGSVSLSPRGDWRMPSDASAALWKSELAQLEKRIQER